jgi:rubredoxin
LKCPECGHEFEADEGEKLSEMAKEEFVKSIVSDINA